MPIPDPIANENSEYLILPEGIYDTNLDEINARLNHWGRTGRRMRLTENLERYIRELSFWQIASEIYIDGSYVCGKDEPDDIDILLVYREGFDEAAEGQPMQENLQDNNYTRRHFGINLWTAAPDSITFTRKMNDLTTVYIDKKVPTEDKKGILRLQL
ncbi:MAG TPA: hypothetical protein VNL38_01930 [Candidatus Nitrosotenuis sp.]|nr:hypothetical protein [Candidatus Nitrosotenuis sp.]